MSLQSDWFTALSATFSTRLYPVVAPERVTLPFATYQVISQVPENVLADTPNLFNSRLQLDIYALKASECETLKASARAAIVAAFGNRAKEIVSLELYEDEVKLHRTSMDWSVWHN